MPHIKIIDTFPELPLDDAACALEAEIAQGEQAINKHGSPVQDCYQQKTCLNLGRGSFIPATKGGKIHRIRFPFEFVREDASQQETQNQNSQRGNISGVFQKLMLTFVVCKVEGSLQFLVLLNDVLLLRFGILEVSTIGFIIKPVFH